MIMFLLSTITFTAISYFPEDLSWLMLPAVILNGVGGITIVFTSFQFGNLFSAARSTVIAVMIGSYNASSFVYTLFLNLYRMGVSFPVLMLVHGGLLFIALVESWFNVPVKPIPTLEEQRSKKSPPRTSVRRHTTALAVQNNAFTIEEESDVNESNEGSNTEVTAQKL
ncbi:Oidioi.mRNA.OKI2018_I69.XSR.g16620.t1.cds [Oikopleura dioica]|nr:Oidioi.mRNA.OKI2018_I69.XSR.g16620.t1.cds [Oikopleura dioica]